MRDVKSPMPDDTSRLLPTTREQLARWLARADPLLRELARMMRRTVTPEEVSGVTGVTVAIASNRTAAAAPGALAGGTVDVVLTLSAPMPDLGYEVAAPALGAGAATLLGLVSPLGPIAKTLTTVTVRLRNTGATPLTVPARTLTAVAVHPGTPPTT